MLTSADGVARRALEAAGIKGGGRPRRVLSTNNEVFLAGENIVRINRTGSNRLLREAKLCLALPRLLWTPEIVAFGELQQASYVILRRKKGSTLARWWPDMRPSQRRHAVEQLAGCMRAIHSTQVPKDLPPLTNPPQMLGSTSRPALPVLHGLKRLRRMRYIDASYVDDLEAKVRELEPAADYFTDSRLIHGDLTFENVLWDGSRVTAILDFEWARGAPRDLDLDVLCRFLALPEAHVERSRAAQMQASDFTDVVAWLAHDYPELFSHQRLRERLALYGIAFDLRATLQNPPTEPEDKLPPLHPFRRLIEAGSDGGPAARLVKPVVSRSRTKPW